MCRARILIVLSLFFAALLPVSADEQPIRFGSVAEDIPAVMHKRLTPLTDYLTKAIGRRVVLSLSPDMTAAIAAVAKNDVDLAYLTPVAYLRAHEAGNAKLIVKVIVNHKAHFRLQIVVRDDSSIQQVSDLAGKSFAFGDPVAIMQKAVLVNAGMQLDKLAKRSYLGHYDNVVRSVLNRDYDAAVLPDSKVRKWEKQGLRVIYSSPQLPTFNISASSKLDPTVFLKLQTALINLNENNPEHRRVLESLEGDINGFSSTTDAEYDLTRKIIKPFR